MTRRLPVVALLLAVVVGALVIDGTADEATVTSQEPVLDHSVFPIASAADARSSTWFCAGGTADEEAFADHVVTLLNTTDGALGATVTVFAGVVAPAPPNPEAEDVSPDASEDVATTTDADRESIESLDPVERVVEVPSHTRVSLAMRDVVTAPIASALVEADGGGLVVEHEVTSIHGHDAKPCATAASDEWHFAWGTTERDARELLVLFNPFPDDAIVEGTFMTEDGVREPSRFVGGLVVPARSTLAVDLGDDITRRAEVTVSLRARTGRIVVDRILRVNEPDGDRGLTVQLGVPRAQEAWVFPDGFLSEDISERYVVYNPGDDVAEVEITFSLDHPDENGVPEPVELSLAPGAHATVDLAEDGRIPTGVGHAAVVRSANRVPVVVERVQSARAGHLGITVTTGSPVEADTWFFPAGSATETTDEVLVVYNLDPRVLAELDVLALAGGQVVPVSELQGVVVEAGERLAIEIDRHIQREDLALLVRSTEPIVIERGLYVVGEDSRGASNAIGIPGPGGIRPPLDPSDLQLDVDLGDDLEDTPTTGGDTTPTAPDDVQLPEPDETIVIDDPDAPATDPTSSTTTTSAPDTSTSSTTDGGVPATAPSGG